MTYKNGQAPAVGDFIVVAMLDYRRASLRFARVLSIQPSGRPQVVIQSNPWGLTDSRKATLTAKQLTNTVPVSPSIIPGPVLDQLADK